MKIHRSSLGGYHSFCLVYWGISDGKLASPCREMTSSGSQLELMNKGTVGGGGRRLSGQLGVLVPGQEHRALHRLKWTSIKGRSLLSLLSVIIHPLLKHGGDSHSCLQGIFPTQESNLDLLHCRHNLYHLNHQRSPVVRTLLLYPLLSVQLSNIKHIHSIVQPSPLSTPRIFSSSQTETLYPLNRNFAFSLSLGPSNQCSIFWLCI